MIQLKEYQQRVLDSLTGFFRQCSRDGHQANAFRDVQAKSGREPAPYIRVHAATVFAARTPRL